MGEKKKDKKKGDAGGEKKDDVVVLKTEMHCDGCAKKIIRSAKSFQGVEDVKADSSTNKITVTGKVDPLKLREKVESKIKKKVELISPLPKKDKDATQTDKNPEEKSDKKKEPPQVTTTVTFKTRLHCEGCTQKIHKSLTKIKGVEAVTIDKLQDLVTVKGTMDVKVLPSYLQKKHKRSVEIIVPKKEKKEGGDGDKKDKNSGGDNKKGGGDEKGEAKLDEPIKAELANKMEYYGPGYGQGYGYGNGYVMDNVHPPQYFSDENPNACSIM